MLSLFAAVKGLILANGPLSVGFTGVCRGEGGITMCAGHVPGQGRGMSILGAGSSLQPGFARRHTWCRGAPERLR